MFSRRYALTLLALVPPACNEEPPPAPTPPRSVRYAEVGALTDAHLTTYPGVSRSSEQSRLSFRVSGPVLEVKVRVGARVSAGQLLARLDSGDLGLQAAEASSAVAQAQAQARQAQAEYERVRTLYEAQGASRSERDSARAQARTAETSLRAARSRAAVARNQARYADLTAPTAGRVSQVTVEAGENVSAGQTVVVLESGEQQEVTVAVPETLIARIERGSSVSVNIPALEQATLPGTVFEVGVAAQSSTYPVTIRLLEEPPGLRPGMAANVSFSLDDADDADREVVIPGVAVAADTEGSFVYVIERGEEDEGVVHRRAVAVGRLTDEGVVIEEGLTNGELVVTAGVSRITDGLTVRVPPLPGRRAGDSPSAQEARSEAATGPAAGGPAAPQKKAALRPVAGAEGKSP